MRIKWGRPHRRRHYGRAVFTVPRPFQTIRRLGITGLSAAPEEPTFEEVDDELADLVRVADRIKAEKKWDKEHTYVIDIIRILHGRIGIRKMDLDAALREKRVADQEPIPKAFDKTVQSVLNQHTSQSKVFRKREPMTICSIRRKESAQERGHCVRMSVPGIG